MRPGRQYLASLVGEPGHYSQLHSPLSNLANVTDQWMAEMLVYQ